uniref:Uncharacterized protein n=1 Tax=Glossina brevipalpis TaxID=37001 RepID=A0A1A9WIL2_9MUSC
MRSSKKSYQLTDQNSFYIEFVCSPMLDIATKICKYLMLLITCKWSQFYTEIIAVMDKSSVLATAVVGILPQATIIYFKTQCIVYILVNATNTNAITIAVTGTGYTIHPHTACGRRE